VKESHRNVLEPLLHDAVVGVFSAYGTECKLVAPENTGHELVAVLGVSSDMLRGGIALGLSGAIARKVARRDDIMERDWAGELANQVLGRIRNQLLRYGVDVALSTPIVLGGMGIFITQARDSPPVHQSFDVNGDRFSAFIDMRFPEGFEFGTPVEHLVAVAEGEVLIF
jgi:CheY-specific phosphatase CheX